MIWECKGVFCFASRAAPRGEDIDLTGEVLMRWRRDVIDVLGLGRDHHARCQANLIITPRLGFNYKTLHATSTWLSTSVRPSLFISYLVIPLFFLFTAQSLGRTSVRRTVEHGSCPSRPLDSNSLGPSFIYRLSFVVVIVVVVVSRDWMMHKIAALNVIYFCFLSLLCFEGQSWAAGLCRRFHYD